MINPIVSVIVPAYNHSKFISECIHSIINQTYKNIQLIVIDDHSKDSTPDLIKELAHKHHFYYELNEKNQGHVKVINKAIQTKAEGKYICMLASDDYVPLDKIEQQVNIMESNTHIDVCTGNAICIDEYSRPILPISKSLFFKEREISFDDLLLGNTIPALTSMIRKNIYERIGYHREDILLEDWYYWLRILSMKGRIFHFNKLWGYYRFLQTSMSRNNDDVLYDAQLRVLDDYKSHFLYQKSVKEITSQFFLKKSLTAKKEGKPLKAIKYLLKRKTFDYEFLRHLKNIFFKIQ